MSEGKKEILLGDCLELMKDIPNGSIDMILCDLPYGTTACKWDTIIPFDKLWAEYKRIIKPKSAIVLTASQPFTTKLINSNIDNFKYCWIWDKKIPSNFALAKRQPLKYHEDVCVFSFEPHNYYPIFRENVKKPFGKIVAGNSEHIKIAAKQERGFGYPKSILEFAKPNNLSKDGNLHSTQKPVELFEYLIKTYTNENDLVLDNTAGSGTTAIACLNTNRQFIVMEKEQKYYDIILKRVGDFNKNFEPQTLFGNDAQLERLSDETMTPEKLKEEISKSKAISDIGKVVVESAKAEILYAKLTGKKEMNPTTFLEEPSRDPNIKALKDKYNNKEA